MNQENEKQEENLVAYCGLHCGDCVIYGEGVANLSKGLLNKLEQSQFYRLATGLSKMFKQLKPLENYGEFCAVLAALDQVRCHWICGQGGGTTGCRIRSCCVDKNIDGCWLCSDFGTCKKLAWLKPIHGEAHLRNLRIINKKGKAEFLRGKRYWYDTKDG